MRPARTLVLSAALGAGLAATLWAQQFKFNLDHLVGKATEHVDLSLNSSMLTFASNFLDGKNADEAKAKKLIAGISGIYIQSFEFKNDGGYSQADLEKIRGQLKAPEWGRMVGIKSGAEGENIEVWVRMEGGKVSGIAILASEPRELTVANLVGTIDLDSLADLGGHFGLPKMKKK